MRVLSIQVGKPRDVVWEGRTISTGIFKSRVEGPVRARALGLEGDGQADLSVHGGVNKAIYAYGRDAYAWWTRELGVDGLENGAFGENLTVSRLVESELCFGDIYALGSARLEVSEPRFPCSKLGIKFEDMGILRTFLRSNRPGVYFRVVSEGEIRAGDELLLVHSDPAHVPLTDLWEVKLSSYSDTAKMSRLLEVKGLSASWRAKLEQKLASLDTPVKT